MQKLMSVIRGPQRPTVQVTPAKSEAVLIWNGKPQPLKEVRSAFGQQLIQKLGNRYVDWDDYALAEAHQTGLTAFACITTRATIASQIPLKVETAQGDSLPQSPASDFIARSREMLWWMTASWLVFGKVYLQKQQNQFGFSNLLEYVNPIDVYPHVNYAAGRIESYRIANVPKPVSPNQMIDIRNPSFTDDFGAVSPLELTMRRISAQESMAQWIASFFANGAKIDGILSYEGGDVTPEEIELQERRWKELFKGAMNAFKTFIAASSSGGSWKWQPIQNNFDELVMPETLKALREDICAAFSCHPTLIGLGSAADALSAQSTYKAVHDEHVQYVTMPLVMRFCEALTEQWLATDFPVYGRLRIVPDLAAIQSDLYATSDRAAVVNTNLMSGAWDVNEGRKFLGSSPVEGIVTRNPTWALSVYQAGGMTLMEMRQAIGLPKSPETYAVTKDGFIYDLDPRYSQVGMLPDGQFSPFPMPMTAATSPADRDIVPPPAPPKPAIAGNPASITLSLANNGDLINLQNRLRQTFADPGIRWLEPEEFHITLISCPVIDDAALMALYEDIASKPLPTLALKVGSLASFDSVGEHAIHFRIRRNQDLIDLQARIAKWCQKNQIEISSYHSPEWFQPHVTMCYAATKTRVIKFEGGLTVSPRELCISRRKGLEDWEDVYTLPMTAAARAVTANPQITELKRWHEKVDRKGVMARFESSIIPASVQGWIRTNLQAGWSPEDVFQHARDWIREGEEDPEPLGAPPDEWAEYWSGFDDIPDNMAELWLTYMEAISTPTLSRALDTTPAEFDLPDLQAERDKLIDGWVGTEDDPGPLLQFMLAGLAAGDRSLKRVTRANVSWDIALTDALAFAREYGYGLIRNIDETTRESIRAVMEKSAEEAWSKAQLETELAKVLVIGGETPSGQIQRRADLIAQTEGIRMFNEGAFKRWDIAGVTRAKWQTVNDGHVCFPAGVIVETDEGPKPIESLKVGMMVKTRKGYKRILATSERSYSGDMVEVVAGTHTVMATGNHPFWTSEQSWLEGRQLTTRHTLQTVNNELVKINRVLHFTLGNSDNTQPTRFEKPCLADVAGGVTMPIIPVYLKSHVVGNNEEINAVPPCLKLLDIFNIQGVQDLTDRSLKASLASISPITIERTKAPISIVGLTPKSLIASRTINADGRSSTFFRTKDALAGSTISVIPTLVFEHPSTSLAGNVFSIGMGTFNAAMGVTVLDTNRDGKLFATAGAGFGDIVGRTDGIIAFLRTVFFTTIKPRLIAIERFAAMDTRPLATLARRLMVTFIRAIHCLSAVEAVWLPQDRRPTVGTPHFNGHDVLVPPSDIDALNSLLVYNIEVEDANEYYANGILVHNCSICKSLHGKVAEFRSGWEINGKTYREIAHPGCRCFRRPVV